MDLTRWYRLNEPAVMSETVDGEAIVVNLETGAYFSLRDSAGEIWELMLAGHTPEAILAVLAARYDWPTEQTGPALEAFLQALLADALIVVDEPPATAPTAATEGFAARGFSAPQLEKYTDMADLLLLDPIHDVDPQAGWPLRKPDQP